MGQAIALLNISGNVNIHYCSFVSCLNSGGHGAAVYYSSNNLQLEFTISDCKFNHSIGNISSLYVGESSTYVTLKNCVFYKNQQTPIYISSKGLKIDGYLLMEENTAVSGGGIAVGDYASITFCEYSVAIFNNNFARVDGGAMYVGNYTKVLFNKTSSVVFYNNKASSGGAM